MIFRTSSQLTLTPLFLFSSKALSCLATASHMDVPRINPASRHDNQSIIYVIEHPL